MKKILIFSTAYLPLIGGAEIAVKEITDRFGSDFDFDLICARIKRGLPIVEKIGRVNVFRAGWGWGKIDKFLLPWRGAALAAKLHEEKKYNLIWAIMASFGGLTALRFKLKHPTTPYLLTLQEGDTPSHIASRARWLGPYYKKIFQRADLITAISQYLKEFALSQGVKKEIIIAPNGVDINKFQSPLINKPGFKSRLGLSIQEKIIITTSRLVPKNGVGDLIDAMSLLPADHKLLILGSGPLEDNLKLKAREQKLEERILFLGSVANDSVPKFLAIADIFVRPALAEGLGNAFFEAMAAGVPVIGTPVGGIRDFLIDRETGLYCEVKNPRSVAEKIKLLFSDESLRKKLILNGRQLMQEKYSWNKIVGQMEEAIKKLTV